MALNPFLGNTAPSTTPTGNSNPMLQGRKEQSYIDWVRGMGLDPNGNNEVGQMLRKLAFGMFPGIAGNTSFWGEMQPQRQEMLRNLISRFSSGNLQATADQNRARLMRQGNQSADMARARVRGMGGSQDAQIGAALAQRNKASQSANDYQNNLFGPQGQMDIAQLLSGAFNQVGDTGMDELLKMFGPIENRHQQNAAEKAQGGIGGALGGVLGSALGGMNWGSMLAPKKDPYGPFVH